MNNILEMSAAEVWELYVGEQSPREFLELSGDMSVEESVEEYATQENFRSMFNDYEGLDKEELEHIRKRMVEYISQE